MAGVRENSREVRLSPKYAPLFDFSSPVRYYIVTGGRGSGKSFAISTAVMADQAEADYNILYLRQTLVSAEVSIIPEFYEKAEMMGFGDILKKSNTSMLNRVTGWRVFFKGIQTSSRDNIAQLKSVKRVGLALVDEAQELTNEEAFDRIDLSLRDKGVRNRIVLSLNPTAKSHWIYRRFFKAREVAEDFNGIRGDTCYIHTTYHDNAQNLDGDFLRLAEECRETNPEKYRNVFLGLWKGDKEGALWSESMVSSFRVASAPASLDRVVVGVDPAVTSADTSDETGIVVVGAKRIQGQRHYYVLADRSMRSSPNSWAGAAVNAFEEFEADRVVAEVNNGGDLVESLVQGAAGKRIPYRAVRASRGKITRAEPVAALYERGLVHHVGTFPVLEDQMRNYCGRDTEKSPDRMDALVWALTELSSKGSSGVVL